METPSPTLLATEHELFVGDLIDQMRRQRQEKSQSYRNLPYFQHLGSDEVFEALDRVRQANLLQMQLKMQKDNAGSAAKWNSWLRYAICRKTLGWTTVLADAGA
eukprot:g29974.t1